MGQILILDWEILQAAGDGEVAMPNGNEFELIDSFITGPVDVYAFTGPEEEALRELGGHYLHVIAATQLIDSPWELTEGTNQLLRSAFSAIRILTHPHLRIPEEKKWTLHSALHQMLEGTSVLFGWRTAMEIGEIWWHRLHSMLAWFKEEHGKVEFDH